MTAELADVIVVGGGIVGTSAAYHLAAAGAGRVLLLERAATVGTGSTGACAGGFRFQFSSRLNIELSLASVPMILGFTEEHGLPLDVAQDGYLFLLREPSEMEAFQAAADLQRSMGVRAHILTPPEAVKISPGISLDGVVGASFCPDDGIADPGGLTQGYASLARRAGAVVRMGVEVSAVLAAGGRVTGVQTTKGPVEAPVVIDAAGPWAGALAASVGVALPMEPVPRMVVTTGEFRGRPERRTLVIDAGTSFYFHREGRRSAHGYGRPGREVLVLVGRRSTVHRRRTAAHRDPRVSTSRGSRDRIVVGGLIRDDAGPPSDHRTGAGRGAFPGVRLQRARLPARAGCWKTACRADRRGSCPHGRHIPAVPGAFRDGRARLRGTRGVTDRCVSGEGCALLGHLTWKEFLIMAAAEAEASWPPLVYEEAPLPPWKEAGASLPPCLLASLA
jgi:glycine/D-amino acid oxidase-like deaminating enzyme